ncbi:MAG: hypothetical protein II956_14430 [Bacteroidales bacterium]|nr:hypothetical protein [Bacteroidales bacterium]
MSKEQQKNIEELPDWLQPQDGIEPGIEDITLEDAKELKELLINLGAKI